MRRFMILVIIRVIKSRRMSWTRDVARVGGRRGALRGLTFWRRIFFFQILARPVFKM